MADLIVNSQEDDLAHFSSGDEAESETIAIICKNCGITFIEGEKGSSSLNHCCPSCHLESSSELCCCGCGVNASGSHHKCSNTNRKVLAFHLSGDVEEGYGSSGFCLNCANLTSNTNNSNSTAKK